MIVGIDIVIKSGNYEKTVSHSDYPLLSSHLMYEPKDNIPRILDL